MSHQRILWYASDTKEGELIKLAMRAKGLTFLADTATPTKSEPMLSDHGTKVVGLVPIIEFLNDKYPEPSLIFTDPSQKAMVRMFIQRLVFGGAYKEIKIADAALASLVPQLNQQPFLLGPRPCLVDLAILPLIRDENSVWMQFKSKVLKAIA